MRNDDKTTSIIALIIVLGVFLFIAYVINESGKDYCIKSGCKNEAASGSSYCYLHKPYTSSSYSTKPKSSSSSSSTTKSSSSTSTTKKSTSSSTTKKSYSSSSSSKKKSSADSYDDGYNAIYEDDDYDWDRYWSDDDYAAGVDDAMEDEDW